MWMDLDAVDYQAPQSDERTPEEQKQQSLMTPARRAVLDALEQEFRDLLNSLPR
jgi:hypothetical protein